VIGFTRNPHTAYVTLTENFTAGVTTTGEFSCTLPYTSPALSLVHIPLDVAGLPVVITPELSWLASASAKISAAAQFSVSQSATAMGGMSFSTQTGFKPLDSLSNTWHVDSSASVSGSATLSMGPQLVFDVDGQGGPSLTLTASLTAKATTSPPSATLGGEITGQAGLDLHIFGVINIQKNATVFDVPKPIWASAAPPSESAPGSTASPSSTPTPSPTPTPTPTLTPTPTPTPATLLISEYGVAMNLTPDVADATYSISTGGCYCTDENGTPYSEEPFVAIWTTGLAADPACSDVLQDGLILIEVFPADSTNLVIPDGPHDFKHLGQYWFGVNDAGNYLCSDHNSKEYPEVESLLQAFDTLHAT
jgi:hypothetical protein